MHHVVDDRAAAGAAAGRRVDLVVVEAGLGDAVVRPVEVGQQQLVPAVPRLNGILHLAAQRLAAGFEDQDLRALLLAQAVGERRSARSRADDHIVEGFYVRHDRSF